MNFSGAVMSSTNFLGFAGGTILYALLLAMVFRPPIRAEDKVLDSKKQQYTLDWFLLITAVLGLLWNIGNLVEIAWRDYLSGQPPILMTVVAYTALGFLPALIVHSAADEPDLGTRFLTGAAYLISGSAGVLHFQNAISFNASLSPLALQILTIGYMAIIVATFLIRGKAAKHHPNEHSDVSASVFSISALHLSQPHTDNRTSLSKFWVTMRA